jgi:cytochrome b
MRWISIAALRLTGWRVEGQTPEKKYADCRTSYQQLGFPVTLMVCFALRLRVYWMGKSSLFPP